MKNENIPFFSWKASVTSPVIAFIATNIIVQPLDLIKITMQTDNPSATDSLIKTAKDIYKTGGLKGFYRGSMLNFVGGGLVSSYRWHYYKVLTHKQKQEEVTNSSIYTWSEFISLTKMTAFISFSLSLFAAPVELARIQVNSSLVDKNPNLREKYSGSFDAIGKIYKKFGLQGLYQGWSHTFFRDFIAYFIFLTSFDGIFRLLDQEELGIFRSSVAGVLSGQLSWLFSYPMDTIKTIIQRDSLEQRKWTAKKYILHLKSQRQLHTLYYGLSTVLIRSAPANLVFFTVWDYSFNLIDKYDRMFSLKNNSL